MSLFSKLFGKSPGPKQEPELYEGCRIFPDLQPGDGGHRIGARIEKDINGETRVHQMVRADQISDAEEATRISLLKAKRLIDEQGDEIFQ